MRPFAVRYLPNTEHRTFATKVTDFVLDLLARSVGPFLNHNREPYVGDPCLDEHDWRAEMFCGLCQIDTPHRFIKWQPYGEVEAECLACHRITEIEPA